MMEFWTDSLLYFGNFYRRAPPGKCNIKPSPVKIKGKLIHFHPKEGDGTILLHKLHNPQTKKLSRAI